MDQDFFKKMGWHNYVIAIYIFIYDILKLWWDRNDAMFASCTNAEGSGVIKIYRVKCIGNKVWIHWSVTGPSISRKTLYSTIIVARRFGRLPALCLLWTFSSSCATCEDDSNDSAELSEPISLSEFIICSSLRFRDRVIGPLLLLPLASLSTSRRCRCFFVGIIGWHDSWSALRLVRFFAVFSNSCKSESLIEEFESEEEDRELRYSLTTSSLKSKTLGDEVEVFAALAVALGRRSNWTDDGLEEEEEDGLDVEELELERLCLRRWASLAASTARNRKPSRSCVDVELTATALSAWTASVTGVTGRIVVSCVVNHEWYTREAAVSLLLGSIINKPFITCFAPGDTWLQVSLSKLISPALMRIATLGVSVRKGGLSDNMKYRIVPRDHMSQLSSYSWLATTSGAAYGSVKQGVCNGSQLFFIRANPKSTIFTAESSPWCTYTIFSGLRSRCTTPRECMYRTADANCRITRLACRSENGRGRCNNSPPESNSITMYVWSRSWWTSINFTTFAWRWHARNRFSSRLQSTRLLTIFTAYSCWVLRLRHRWQIEKLPSPRAGPAWSNSYVWKNVDSSKHVFSRSDNKGRCELASPPKISLLTTLSVNNIEGAT